jgi:hypothetical protein
VSEPRPGRRRWSWLGLTLVAAGVVAVLAGLIGLEQGRGGHGSVPGATSGSPSATPELGTTATPKLAKPVPGRPVDVRIPALGVNAPVLPVHAPHRTLVPPSDPQQLGWWADGAEPGDQHGAVLIAGHTVHNGPGALNALGTLKPGARVLVRTSAGHWLRYRADSVRTFSKGTIAAQAGRLFAQRGPARLVVVTCADWNGTRYLSNSVVVAVPA